MLIERRKFTLGTEWLYLKIYTGVKTSDIILEEVIQPMIQGLRDYNYISKWFFIRYHDPKPHLRLRLCLRYNEDYKTVLDKIIQELERFNDSGEISNISIETYSREIERYGQERIVEAEELFYKNSEFTLMCLSYNDEDKIVISIFYIIEILKKLNLTTHEKYAWIQDSNNLFKKEFNADKNLNSQLDKKYRKLKPKLKIFIESDEFLNERRVINLHLEECAVALHNILSHCEEQSLEVPLQSFFQSIFHMNLNRLFVSNQRLFEMVIYDYLLRYYKSVMFYDNNIIVGKIRACRKV